MDTGHDQGALLRRAERGVIETRTFGVFQIQFLEGPTDNPIRVLAPGGVKFRERYDFAIDGAGWSILVDILREGRKDKHWIPYYLSCFIAVVRKFPRGFDLLEAPVRIVKG